MKANVTAEIIGRPRRKPWVAEVLGRHHRYGLEREFVPMRVSYKHANKRGTRGVFAHWVLEDGRLYESRRQTGWDDWEHVWLTATPGGDVEYLTDEEATEWLDVIEAGRPPSRHPKPPPRPVANRGVAT